MFTNSRSIVIQAALFASGILVGGLIFSFILDYKISGIRESGAFKSTSSEAKAVSFGRETVLPSETAFTYASSKTMDGVVYIKTTEGESQAEQGNNLFHFFNGRGGQVSAGSGVIVSKEGYIVTNAHVVENASKIRVTLNNNSEYEAEMVAQDLNTDLAVIRIKTSEPLTPIVMANSDEVQIGQWVLALGNPMNLNSTVTAGIVSAKARNIGLLREQLQYSIESFIQTDAAVNPGNSGGALLNLKGQLIGINTAIATETGFYAGYSFAIPSNLVQKVVNDLINYGNVQRGFIGVNIRDINNELFEEQDLAVREGIYIAGLAPGGSAEDAGLRKGDVIVAVDDKLVKNTSELQEIIVDRYYPGDKVTVSIFRSGDKKNVSLRLKDKNGLVTKRARPKFALPKE
jgi:S1-C subfamily serine protease